MVIKNTEKPFVFKNVSENIFKGCRKSFNLFRILLMYCRNQLLKNELINVYEWYVALTFPNLFCG